MINSLLAGLAVIGCSVLGSLAGIIYPKISHRTNDIFLGFAAGVMLAAAFVGLLPSVFVKGDVLGIVLGVVGVFAGAIVISLADRFVPHSHFHDGQFSDSEAKAKSNNKVLLLVIAIAIHNIPEGLATGMALSGGVTSNGLTIIISMMLQKIPEGLIVVLPLLSTGMKKGKAFIYSIIVALMMLPGVLIGIFFGTLPAMFNLFFTAFTFGAIVYVISDEVIPESHQHGHQKVATFALIVGILSVVIIGCIF